MAIDRAQVEHVARLARLGLSEAEKETMAAQLSRILDHVAVLQRLDTTAVPPTFHVLPNLQNVFRPDVVLESLPREQALANAPQQEQGCFKVPRITET